MKGIYNFDRFRILEWEETDGKIPHVNYIQYMDELYKDIRKKIQPKIPNNYKIDYERGRKITIHTDNKQDLLISIEIQDDKILYFVKPIHGVEFEFNFSFSIDISEIIKMIDDEFSKDENKGIYKETEIEDDFDDFDDVKYEKPAPKKPVKRKRTIDLEVIKTVLEDAYILDDIDLLDTTVEELLRRMISESKNK